MTFNKQECIPVGCVPSAAVAVSPTMHGTPNPPRMTPAMHPSVMHTPCHTYPSGYVKMRSYYMDKTGVLPCIPPLHHACPTAAPPHHAHTLLCIPPNLDRILDTRLWKHYLSATTVADDNKRWYFLPFFWNISSTTQKYTHQSVQETHKAETTTSCLDGTLWPIYHAGFFKTMFIAHCINHYKTNSNPLSISIFLRHWSYFCKIICRCTIFETSPSFRHPAISPPPQSHPAPPQKTCYSIFMAFLQYVAFYGFYRIVPRFGKKSRKTGKIP